MHGAFKGKTLYFNEGLRGTRQVYPFRMADGRGEGPLSGTFRFRIIHGMDEDRFDTDINGATVAPQHVQRTVHAHDPEMSWTWAEIDLGDCPPFRFDNELGITWRSDTAGRAEVPYLEEVDILVQP